MPLLPPPRKRSALVAGGVAYILFASIQTLSRRRHLHRFGPRDFDYLVLDEFHHAAARSYRRLIGYFEPRFLLGLTATPWNSSRSTEAATGPAPTAPPPPPAPSPSACPSITPHHLA